MKNLILGLIAILFLFSCGLESSDSKWASKEYTIQIGGDFPNNGYNVYGIRYTGMLSDSVYTLVTYDAHRPITYYLHVGDTALRSLDGNTFKVLKVSPNSISIKK